MYTREHKVIIGNYQVTDDGAMSPPAANRRMKTSTMLLLNFILQPSGRASKFASFKFVMHTAPRAVEYRSRLFMNRQTSGGWWETQNTL